MERDEDTFEELELLNGERERVEWSAIGRASPQRWFALVHLVKLGHVCGHVRALKFCSRYFGSLGGLTGGPVMLKIHGQLFVVK